MRRAARGSFKLAILFPLVAAAFLGGLVFWIQRHDMTPKVPADARATASLQAERGGALYAPGAQPGVPMWFELPDVQPTSQVGWFVKAGFRGLAGTPEPAIGKNFLAHYGFPVLHLAWPSHALPPSLPCDLGVPDPARACPVFSWRVLSHAHDREQLALLEGKGRLRDQQQTAFDDRVVSQWTAFITVKEKQELRPRWQGWLCDDARSTEMNTRIRAWGAERGLAAVAAETLQAQCAPPGARKRWWPWGAQVEEHAVLWTCASASCRAHLVHAGRIVEIELPGGVLKGTERTSAPQRLRAQVVQATWLALEEAAAAAQPGAALPDARARLKRELAWCEALDAHSQRALELTRDAEGLHKLWDQPDWRIATVHPRSPCARALHRILGLRATANDAAGQQALLAAAKRLAEIERARTGRLSEPLWTLVGEFIARQSGAPSVELLQWQAQDGFLHGRAEELLQAHDALGDAVGAMPPAARLKLRVMLAQAVESSGGRRSSDLYWLAAKDWAAAPETVEPERAASLLVWTALSARRLSQHERSNRLHALVPHLEDLARTLQKLPADDPRARAGQVATLALHAAWSANTLVKDGAPEAAQWRAWLTGWAAWTREALAATRPDVVQAVALHREAAAKSKALEPDCPGGPLLQCPIFVP
jgi:hypothetical protein